MSDQRISDLTTATSLSASAIIPVAQIDPSDNILKNFGVAAGLFGQGTYPYPNDPITPVTTADVGLLAMNDGSGTAKVYTLGAPASAKPGKWQITLTPVYWAALTSSSTITINNVAGGNYYAQQTNWRSGQPMPTDGTDELNLIKASIDAANLGLTTAVSGDVLTITENTYGGTTINTNNFPTGSFTIVQLSVPGWPSTGTAFPLGKIIALDGSNVLISSQYVETYTMDPATSIDNSLMNTANYQNLDFSSESAILATSKALAVPGENGTVAAFDITQYTIDGNFEYAMHTQILGFILRTDGSNVTVMHFNGLSPILNMGIKIAWFGNNNQ